MALSVPLTPRTVQAGSSLKALISIQDTDSTPITAIHQVQVWLYLMYVIFHYNAGYRDGYWPFGYKFATKQPCSTPPQYTLNLQSSF